MNFRSYIIAGKLLHIITLIEITALFFLIPRVLGIETHGSLLIQGFKIYTFLFLLSLPVFSQLDARSRYQNYKQIKDQIYKFGFDERILKPVLKSRCQRDAAWLSARELGYGNRCKLYFKSKGYYWIHLFPDFIFKQPQFLLTRYFWKTTFFTSTYNPKYDYNWDVNSVMFKISNPLIHVD